VQVQEQFLQKYSISLAEMVILTMMVPPELEHLGTQKLRHKVHHASYKQIHCELPLFSLKFLAVESFVNLLPNPDCLVVKDYLPGDKRGRDNYKQQT
jgi:hypothetical protein